MHSGLPPLSIENELLRNKVKELEDKLKEEESNKQGMAECPEVSTGKKCTACETGDVMKGAVITSLPFDPHDCIGPGRWDKTEKIVTYYCNNCGVMYKFPPRD